MNLQLTKPQNIQPQDLFHANSPSYGNFPANVQWALEQNRQFSVIYQHPPNKPNAQIENISTQEALKRKEWFDNSFLISHQKYIQQDFSAAYQLLVDLYRLNPAHLPTLLLLGCTCYSLELYHLSIFYNDLILRLDPQFSEAYSNLGTTHRAIARLCELSITPAQNITELSSYHNNLAEHFYKAAISVNPRYWDARVNLAGLIGAQGRIHHALLCYDELENLFEFDFILEELHKLGSFAEKDDLYIVEKLQLLEIKRRQSPNYSSNEYTPTKRRDLALSKGNLHLATGNVVSAKFEFIKALLAAEIDLVSIFINSKISVSIPACSISPTEAIEIFQKCQNNPLVYSHHSVTSTLLQTLAKIYQDNNFVSIAVSLYYLSLKFYPTPNTANNLGIILSQQRLDESIGWYEFGLSLDPKHVHLYTNLGSALKDQGRISDGINCYQIAISIQPDFYIALANLGNVFKDLGNVEEALILYKRALHAKPDFIEAFCNYVNSSFFICDWRDRSHNLTILKAVVQKQLLEGEHAIPPTVPTILPFHTFTYSNMEAWMVREISRRNADRALFNILTSEWFPGFPLRPKILLQKSIEISEPERIRALSYPYPYNLPTEPNPHIKIGYVSSDFNNHPLSHLMQSVFGMHDRTKFKVYCYSLSPSDSSPFRVKIEKECDFFHDVSNWNNQNIVEKIVSDGIHILCNLNGYTKGGRNEIFAARPSAIHISLMGFAGTMGAGSVNDSQYTTETNRVDNMFFDDLHRRWMDYLVTDEISSPKYLVCGEPLEKDEEPSSRMIERGLITKNQDTNRIYTEGMIYMPHTYFVNDHRQGFREPDSSELDSLFENEQYKTLKNQNDEESLTTEECIKWRKEQIKRIIMRNEIFPYLHPEIVIFANFNQLYKIDPDIFAVWMNIIKRIENSVLWLLRFPACGEQNLIKQAIDLVGEKVASRIIFTDVAPKDVHIHRGRVADIFLDTPECNAHTTAADILWSGTPIVTFPKYDFKMCSRVASSVAFATGSWGDWANPSDKTTNFATNSKIPRLSDVNLLGHLMVVSSYEEYENRAVLLGKSLSWNWKKLVNTNEIPINSKNIFLYPDAEIPTHIYTSTGLCQRLRQRLFLTRDSMPLFDTNRWVKNLENGFIKVYKKWQEEYKLLKLRNQQEISGKESLEVNKIETRCFYILESK